MDIESRLVDECQYYFICPICRDVMKKAAGLPCGHEFCTKCICTSYKSRAVCPVCIESFQRSQVSPAYEKRKRIERLEIKCKNTECKYTSQFCKINDHEKCCCFGPEVRLKKEIKELDKRSKIILKKKRKLEEELSAITNDNNNNDKEYDSEEDDKEDIDYNEIIPWQRVNVHLTRE